MTFDQLPPQNPEAELGVIGSTLMDNDCIHKIADLLQPEDFYRDTHQILYRGIIGLYRGGRAVDAITLIDHLTRHKRFEQAGGDDTIRQALEETPSSANAYYYAQIVKQRAVSRRVIEEAQQIMRDAYSNNFTADELVQSFERKAFGLSQGTSSIAVVSIEDAVTSTMNRFRAISDGNLDEVGISTGFSSLDAMLGGLRSRFYVLAAHPGNGKSSYGLNLLRNVAERQRRPALFFSMEMDLQELSERYIADVASVDSRRIRTPHLARDADRARLLGIEDRVAGTPIAIVDRATISLAQLASLARRHKAQCGLSLVVVDYLQKITPENPRDPRHEQVASISRGLTNLAQELDAPILAISQVRRTGEQPDKPLRMCDLKESGEIESNAHGVWLLNRDKVSGDVEFDVAKNRGGPTGTFILKFDAAYTRFYEDHNHDRYL